MMNMLYSLNGTEPQELPERIKFPGGRTHYLAESPLSESELQEAGWTGPYEKPGYVLGEEKVIWDQEATSYKVNKLNDAEKATLWASKCYENAKVLTELRGVAENRMQQLEALGLPTEAVTQFLVYLNAAELPGSNPFLFRLPPLSLLSTTSSRTALNDPLSDWLIANFESDLSHGYHVEGKQLQVRDEQAFEVYKKNITPLFLADYLEKNQSAVCFVAEIVDNFNGTGEAHIEAYGIFDEILVSLDGSETPFDTEVLKVQGSGTHRLEITPYKNGEICGNTDTCEFTLI